MLAKALFDGKMAENMGKHSKAVQSPSKYDEFLVSFRSGSHPKWHENTKFPTLLLPHRQIKYPVNFDDELKIGDVRYDDMTKITIKQQLF